MAIPSSITTEEQQLKNTLIKEIEINPPAELKIFETFKADYQGLELDPKVNIEDVDKALFKHYKQNQLDYANGLSGVLQTFKTSEPKMIEVDQKTGLLVEDGTVVKNTKDIKFLADGVEYRMVAGANSVKYSVYLETLRNTQDNYSLEIKGGKLISSNGGNSGKFVGTFELVK